MRGTTRSWTAIRDGLIALAANPHMSGYECDLPAPELAALRVTLREAMQALMDEYEYLPAEVAAQVGIKCVQHTVGVHALQVFRIGVNVDQVCETQFV